MNSVLTVRYEILICMLQFHVRTWLLLGYNFHFVTEQESITEFKRNARLFQ